jgi:hypothetical protein
VIKYDAVASGDVDGVFVKSFRVNLIHWPTDGIPSSSVSQNVAYLFC